MSAFMSTLGAAMQLMDWRPVGHLLLSATVLALGPLTWVWLRAPQAASAPEKRQQRVRLLSWILVFLTFDLIVLGAFTRLSDSGLGCPDWPGCYGHFSPVQAQHDIRAAEAALPDGPVTWGKAWIEMLHRYLAMAVGVLILSLALFVWRQKQVAKEAVLPLLPLKWPLLCLLWVGVQGAFGAFTVTLRLMPLIVTLHLLGALILLVLLQIQAHQAARLQATRPQAAGQQTAGTQPAASQATLATGWRRTLYAAAVLLLLQIALGAWVSSNYAVLACNTLPLCQGQWWPEMNFSQGFELLRPLGLQANGDLLQTTALTAIHQAHRVGACVLFVVLGVLSVQLAKWPVLRKSAKMLGHLLLAQVLTGLANVLLNAPLLAALAHSAGAAGLVMCMTQLLLLTTKPDAHNPEVLT